MTDLFQDFILISGGQTGVDQGALEAAMVLHLNHGGWCPKGRKSEDGPIPPRFNLQEHASSKYPPRTKKNIEDSDGTLILGCGPFIAQGPGTTLTERHATSLGKPCLYLDLASNFLNQVASEDLLQVFPDTQSFFNETAATEIYSVARVAAGGRGLRDAWWAWVA